MPPERTTTDRIQAPLSRVTRRYCTMAMGYALPVGALLIVAGLPAMGKGLILGALFAAVDFVLMAQALPLRLAASAGQAGVRAWVVKIGRFALKAVPLVIAVRLGQIDFPMTVVGLFAVQICLLADSTMKREGSRG